MASSKKQQKAQKQPVKRAARSTPTVPYQYPWQESFWKSNMWAAILLVILSVALYLPAIQYDFVLDDKIVYSENNFVKKGLSGVWEIFSTESFQGYFGEQKDLVVGARYRPLSIVTFAVEHHFFGLNPKVGHVGNIIFYALSVLLVFRVLFLMFPGTKDQMWYLSLPFLASVLFVTHPLHVEVVANIKGRDEILTMMGAFGALYFSFRYLKSNQPIQLIFSGLSFFLGLLAKENAITFLAIIPASIYFFTKASSRQHLKVFLPLIVVTLVYLIIRYQIIGYFLSSGKPVVNLMNNPFIEMNGSERLATIFYTLGIYLKLLFFPHPLTHDYYPYHIPIMNWGKPGSIISIGIYLALGVYALIGFRRKQVLSYLIFFYIATLSIVSNLFFPVGTFMNERFIFISSIAFCILLPWLAINKVPGLRWKEISVAGLMVIAIYVAGFSYKTIDRLPAWKNGFTLNSEAIKVSKNSARANVFMSTAYFEQYKESNDPEEKRRLLDVAQPFVDRALEIHPSYSDGLTMLSGIAAERFRDDGQMEPLLDALFRVGQHRPGHTFFNQYLDYLGGQRHRDVRMEQFYIDLAYKYHLLEIGNVEQALYLLSKAIAQQPNSAKINLATSRALERKGDTQRASEYANKALSLNPNVKLD